MSIPALSSQDHALAQKLATGTVAFLKKHPKYLMIDDLLQKKKAASDQLKEFNPTTGSLETFSSLTVEFLKMSIVLKIVSLNKLISAYVTSKEEMHFQHAKIMFHQEELTAEDITKQFQNTMDKCRKSIVSNASRF